MSSPKAYHASSNAEAYLRDLPALMSQFAGCDLLLYGVGTDAHINAPLGG